MKLSKIILSEATKVTSLDKLGWYLINTLFPEQNRGSFGISFPNPDDSSRMVQDEEDFESWKSTIKSKYGNVNIKIDTEAHMPFERIQILDDKFRSDKKQFISSKAKWLDKERKQGRNTDLD